LAANSDWGRSHPSYDPDMLSGPSAADETMLLVYLAGLLAAAAIGAWLWILADKRATSRRWADARLRTRQEALQRSQQVRPEGLPPESANPEAENSGAPNGEA
jgi:hypothetical protein